MKLFQHASTLQFQGRLQQAIGAYQRSIAAFPTAEAYTFLGWTYSWMGEYELAIAEAKKAIEVDPDFGNPYNDIGAYLVEMGELDEAIPWFERATTAKRYASPHYPHVNLGEVWVRKGSWDKALASYEAALRLAPKEPLPPLPALQVSTSPPSGESAERPEDDLQAISEVMVSYIQAWNDYDPEALLDISPQFSVGTIKLMLLHLARAKLERLQIRLLDTSILYFTGPIAVARTLLEVDQTTIPVLYLLSKEDGDWKVVGPATERPREVKTDSA